MSYNKVIKCKHCGKIVKSTSEFCKKCGVRLAWATINGCEKTQYTEIVIAKWSLFKGWQILKYN